MVESQKYKVIHLHSFKKDPELGFEIKNPPKADEVMVKVLRATAHPSDLMFIKGLYGLVPPSSFPIIPGFEGSGIIEEVGTNVSKDLIGKYCSVGSILTNTGKRFEGVWAQYAYVRPDTLIIYDSQVDLNNACFAFANPLTAYGFIDLAKKYKAKAVIQNGAFSALGKIFVKVCLQEKLPLINLVRREEQIKLLNDMGAKYVINTASEGWEKKLQILIKELNPTLAFDCVGGNATKALFSLLPMNSTLVHFGNLELKKLNGFDTSEFIFQNKAIVGFWLNYWLAGLSKKDRIEVYSKLKKEIESNSDIIKTTVNQEVPIDDFLKGLTEYANNMSKGKIVIKPHF